MEGTILAATHGVLGRAYNIGGGSRVSMRAVLDFLKDELGGPEIVIRPAERGDALDTAADISRATADLGYRPAWTIDAGLREQIAWHRARRNRSDPAVAPPIA